MSDDTTTKRVQETMVIALDIDGVLNNDAWCRAVGQRHSGVVSWSPAVALEMLDPARCARVQSVCDATGASLVIVSGWRRWAAPETIAEWLRARGLTAPVIGAVDGVRLTGETRASAWREWLAEHPEVTAWCVLDDTASHWQEYRSIEREEVRDGRLMRVCLGEYYTPKWLTGRWVKPVDGITAEDASRCVEILGEVTL